MNDDFGDRIKELYEDPYRITLPGRMPVMLRIDGKAFSSLTAKCERPFDNKLIAAMDATAIYLCDNIQNADVAYVQSDEINILLTNYKKLTTQSWFNNNLVKMCSVAAGLASSYFTCSASEYLKSIAAFDCRAFVLPKEEVNNAFLFRQQDASRNAISMVARTLYSHKELNGKTCNQMQEMMYQKGMNFNDLPVNWRRGRCIVKESYDHSGTQRSKWVIDNNIPIFSQDVNYINKYVYPKEEE